MVTRHEVWLALALTACGGDVASERDSESGADAGGIAASGGSAGGGGSGGPSDVPGFGGHPGSGGETGCDEEPSLCPVVDPCPYLELSEPAPHIASECAWSIPEIPTDFDFDPSVVNVTVTYGSDGDSKQFLYAQPDEAGCAEGGGWYYDDPVSPMAIVLCGMSCEVIEGLPDPVLTLELGCVEYPPNLP